MPPGCEAEAALVARREVRSARNLCELVEVLADGRAVAASAPAPEVPADVALPDLADVRGQVMARLAIEAAAAGGHHLLLLGPPGAGKTMLAQRLPSLLPALGRDLALETTMIHSAAGLPLPGGLVRRPPLRAPHHTASLVAMVGGGTASMRPGEVSLAHGGVLFLDELGEFQPAVLDGLRQPLEEGVVRVTRAGPSVEFASRFLLVAAMNPCPCGAAVNPVRAVRRRGARYRAGCPAAARPFRPAARGQRPAVDELLGGPPASPPPRSTVRVRRARATAAARGDGLQRRHPGPPLDELAPLSPGAEAVLRRELEADRLTGRGLHRVRRVARTLADLRGRQARSSTRRGELSAQPPHRPARARPEGRVSVVVGAFRVPPLRSAVGRYRRRPTAAASASLETMTPRRLLLLVRSGLPLGAVWEGVVSGRSEGLPAVHRLWEEH